jgi:hypothetical protein
MYIDRKWKLHCLCEREGVKRDLFGRQPESAVRKTLSQSFLSVMAAIMVLAPVAVPALALPAAAGRVLPASVAAGGEFEVAIQPSDCGAFGQVEETLPEGFTYLSCAPEDIGVEVMGGEIKFTFLGSDSFTYRVRAPLVESTTTYIFQGVVKDENGESYAMVDGEVEVKAVAPVVAVNDASDIMLDSATLGGVLESLGSSSRVAVSFEWGSGPDYGNETVVQEMTSAGSFSCSLVDLMPQTTYYYRVKAVGSSMGYSEAKSFTTLSPCFIATAAYGTPAAQEIDVLREFRDDVLLPTNAGSMFVACYYRFSPLAADFISRHESLRVMVRKGFIDPLVTIVQDGRSLWNQ